MIRILNESVVYQNTDAIVNAANTSLLGGGGVDGAIHKAAGPQLLEECKTLNGCKTGEAKITKGYNLKARYVIHTVGPVYHNSTQDAILLADCYINCLNLAKEYNLKSISFCCISTGVYAYPLEEATQIAHKTTTSWLKDNNYPIDISFCCYTKEEYDIYNRIFINGHTEFNGV